MTGTDEHTGEYKDGCLAYALLRMILGLIILMHGVDTFLTGPTAFTARITEQFAHTALPHWSLVAFATLLPWLDVFLGFITLLGLWTRSALIAGGLLLIVLTFGEALIGGWPVVTSHLTYALIYSGLLFLRSYNRYSIDSIIFRSGAESRS